jgi:hypothetical protein
VPASRAHRSDETSHSTVPEAHSTVRHSPLDGAGGPTRRCRRPHSTVRHPPLNGAGGPTRRCRRPHSTVPEAPLNEGVPYAGGQGVAVGDPAAEDGAEALADPEAFMDGDALGDADGDGLPDAPARGATKVPSANR